MKVKSTVDSVGFSEDLNAWRLRKVRFRGAMMRLPFPEDIVRKVVSYVTPSTQHKIEQMSARLKELALEDRLDLQWYDMFTHNYQVAWARLKDIRRHQHMLQENFSIPKIIFI